jgi:hypothetical protein
VKSASARESSNTAGSANLNGPRLPAANGAGTPAALDATVKGIVSIGVLSGADQAATDNTPFRASESRIRFNVATISGKNIKPSVKARH